MTEYTADYGMHDTAVKVDVYPNEFKPLLKLINRALMSTEIMDALTDVEAHYIYHWLDDFQSLALEHGV